MHEQTEVLAEFLQRAPDGANICEGVEGEYFFHYLRTHRFSVDCHRCPDLVGFVTRVNYATFYVHKIEVFNAVHLHRKYSQVSSGRYNMWLSKENVSISVYKASTGLSRQYRCGKRR